MKTLLTAKELAANAGVSVRTIKDLAKKEGILPASKRGTTHLFLLKDFVPYFAILKENHLKKGIQNVKPKNKQELTQSKGTLSTADGKRFYEAILEQYSIEEDANEFVLESVEQLAFIMIHIKHINRQTLKQPDDEVLVAQRAKLLKDKEVLVRQLERLQKDVQTKS